MSMIFWTYSIGVLFAMAGVGWFMATTTLKDGEAWRPAGTAFFVLAWPLVVAGIAVLVAWITVDEWRKGRSR